MKNLSSSFIPASSLKPPKSFCTFHTASPGAPALPGPVVARSFLSARPGAAVAVPFGAEPGGFPDPLPLVLVGVLFCVATVRPFQKLHLFLQQPPPLLFSFVMGQQKVRCFSKIRGTGGCRCPETSGWLPGCPAPAGWKDPSVRYNPFLAGQFPQEGTERCYNRHLCLLVATLGFREKDGHVRGIHVFHRAPAVLFFFSRKQRPHAALTILFLLPFRQLLLQQGGGRLSSVCPRRSVPAGGPGLPCG